MAAALTGPGVGRRPTAVPAAGLCIVYKGLHSSMRWMLSCVAAVFLLAVTPASAQDYEATRLAAEQGDADAQYNLGVMFANGWDVPQDDAEAVQWYRLAALLHE